MLLTTTLHDMIPVSGHNTNRFYGFLIVCMGNNIKPTFLVDQAYLTPDIEFDKTFACRMKLEGFRHANLTSNSLEAYSGFLFFKVSTTELNFVSTTEPLNAFPSIQSFFIL